MTTRPPQPLTAPALSHVRRLAEQARLSALLAAPSGYRATALKAGDDYRRGVENGLDCLLNLIDPKKPESP